MKSYENFRDKIVDLVRRDLYGPYAGADEVIPCEAEDDTPVNRYSTGILYPSESVDENEDDDFERSLGNSAEYEGRLSQSNSRYPSCYGFTFTCSAETESFMLSVYAARYNLHSVERDGEVLQQWKREEVKPVWAEGDNLLLEIPVVRKDTFKRIEVCKDLEVYIKYRLPISDGRVSLTVSLINTAIARKEDEEDGAKKKRKGKFIPYKDLAVKCFYQINLAVLGQNEKAVFTERPFDGCSGMDDEQKSFHLLYRHSKGYAVGHGCSVKWNSPNREGCSRIETCFIPEHEIFPMVPPEDLGLPDFRLADISEAENASTVAALFTPILEKYSEWIEKRAALIDEISISADEEVNGGFIEVARRQHENCMQSLERIRGGIESLNEPRIFRAFQLAHRAMLIVFAHSQWKINGYEGSPDYEGDHKWRPFQIAFILQCLESSANPSSQNRNIADLLWFPTGGGKTEAYLGLTAFIFYLRRLEGLETEHLGAGTSVIMRYTLRLLTADQFERASTMVCACEKIRREEGDLRDSAPISIGLWVGGGVTPNHINKPEIGYRQLIDKLPSIPPGATDPRVLKECPYCGTSLRTGDYDPQFPLIRCPDKKCLFSDGLPIHFVDEDVYEKRPSLIIGTIDKFARLPWEEKAGRLFGCDGMVPPPDMIIQDELHLISGPLGTLAGLYETAVDLLCTRGDYRPKVIASTATIRNAVSQVRGLFDREFAQFPPPFIDARDSFFAREDRTRSSRKYLGIFTPGKTGTTTFIRSTSCLLHAGVDLEGDSEIRDPYCTFLGYFNSLRELGSARVQIMDDVNAYLRFCGDRDGSPPRAIDEVYELTSRRDANELRNVKSQLWKPYGDEDGLDAVLATNMISVGLDVPRLGLMSVIGQPKTTAEYIQATSRIGRKYPGLVVMVYNHMRSRDRSHYERFPFYHSRLYAEVEATSVTPFSIRARERALHAIFITLVRHQINGMGPNNAARDITRHDSQIENIKVQLIDRVKHIDPLEEEGARDIMDRIIEKWRDRAANNGKLSYFIYRRNQRDSLMQFFDESADSGDGFRTMNNLRNVDATIKFYME